MHLLAVVVLLNIAAIRRQVQTVWVVFCIGLGLEKLGLLELTRHGWLLVGAIVFHLLLVDRTTVEALSLTVDLVEFLKEVLVHLLFSVEHLAWVGGAWRHHPALDPIAVLIVNELVIFALHCRVETLVGNRVRGDRHSTALRVRA